MNGSNEKRIQPQLPIEALVGNTPTTHQAKAEQPLLSVDQSDPHSEASEHLTLVDLDQRQLESIYDRAPGGAANVAAIYPLSPLQEGMLFHHLLEVQSDTYILSTLLELQSSNEVDALIKALENVVSRHEVLRIAVLWEGLPKPLQVVHRQVKLPVEYLQLDASRDALEQLRLLMRPGALRIEPRRAPMMKLVIATHGTAARRHALLYVHHLICDHQSLRTVVSEALVYLNGDERKLAAPPSYRSYVEDLLTRTRGESGDAFFREKLGDVTELTAAFGINTTHDTRVNIEEARADVSMALSELVRETARRMNASPARLFHAAWGLVVSRTSGQDDVVYGTVILAGMQRRSSASHMVGMAINTVPLRLRLSGLTAQELVQLTHRELVQLVGYDHVPLTTARRCSGVGASAPLFNALLNFRHSARDVGGEFSFSRGIRVLERGEAWASYPVAVTVDDFGDKFSLIAQTDSSVRGYALLEYLCTALQSLADALLSAPETPVQDLEIVPPKERRRLIDGFNDTHGEYPREKLIHELFEARAEHFPDAIAIVCDGQCLTYSALNRVANQLARYMVKRGFRAGEPVPIVMPRSREMIIAQLAILKIGGIYVPVDPLFPAERQAFIIRDCGARHVLLQAGRRSDLVLEGMEEVAIEDALNAAHDMPSENLSARALAPTPAYIMYTSGSTGTPKGVIVPHHAVNRLVFNSSYAEMGAQDCFAHTSNPAFDAATFELWGALLVGARVVIVPQDVLLDGQRLADMLFRERVTVLWITVGLFRQHLDALVAVMPQLRYLITGGDVVDPALIRRIPAQQRPRHLLNAYGPTECTTFSTTYDVSTNDEIALSLPIGRPIGNTRVYILDRHLRPAPIGVPGEIYIGGDGVALGYLNRPELTAERFIVDPFALGNNSKMYRSGDLGRWTADGNIQFLGRTDLQVKIRGFRVELGEIEDHLNRHPALKEAVVLAREDVKGDKRLVAYLKCKESGESGPPSPDLLREYLKKRVPDHMVPSAFAVLEQFPLTANGKIDRRALPAPEVGSYVTRHYEPPRGQIEEIVAAIWQKLLRVDRISRHDNFFELGGNSLLVVQMMGRLRRIGLSTEVRTVLESASLCDLAKVLLTGSAGQAEPPANVIPPACALITPEMLPLVQLSPQHIASVAREVPGGMANIQDIYPLVPLQEGMLFHHLLDGRNGDTYLVPVLISLASRQVVEKFSAALQQVIDRHDALRTAVFWEGLPQPVQVVQRHATLLVEEIGPESGRQAGEVLRAQMTPEGQMLDLHKAPLMRLRVGPEFQGTRWYALLQLHHLVCDNMSLDTIFREVASIMEGEGARLPEAVGYRQYVSQVLARSRRLDHAGYFRSKLGDVLEPTTAFGLTGAQEDAVETETSRELIDPVLGVRLRTQARRLGVSAATLFHCAWSLVVAHASGRDDVVFGTVLLGRLQGSADAQQSIGLFINTLPLRLDLHRATARELVEHTQRELVELLNHEDGSLVVAQGCSGIPGAAPLFSTLLNYRHQTVGLDSELEIASGLRILAAKSWTNYPVLLSVDEREDHFALTAQTDRSVDPQRVVGYMREALRSLVDALESPENKEALSLEILPVTERLEVLSKFNATAAPYPTEALVHELFEEQVRLNHDAVAIVHEGTRVTYGELNSRANVLARYLRTSGVEPAQPVGICVDRGIEMVIGVLGILKAGGAYLPLDPNYPVERLQHMLEDADPRIVLTQKEVMPVALSIRAKVVPLDGQFKELAANGQENLSRPNLGRSAEQLVYVIYTSGSTGRPKGTSMAHRSMVNLIEWHRSNFPNGTGTRVLQFAALSFDVAFQEIFSTLCTGGTLVLVDEWIRKDARALTAFLRNHSIQRLFIPPLMLQSLAECARTTKEVPEDLQDVITAGEQLRISPEVISFFRRLNRCRLHNHYGPTETHVVTALTLSEDPGEWPSLPAIGRPIANTQIYVLDGALRPVPLGVAGEIYIGGAGVACGYFGKPELTAQRFIRDPFGSEPAGRLYRTGDLGRWQADGTLAYLGRNDFQVKIRGYRIELGEIEAQLARHARVKEAAVVAREDELGQKSLVAYATPRDEEAPSVEDLRAHLKTVLPEYMVPSAIVLLDELPLTPSGKLDRRLLPAPELNAYARQQFEPPEGEVEEILAGVWQDLLHVERIGRNDNFFELGGHSLLIVQMMERLRRVGLSAEVRRVFECSTLCDLASALLSSAVGGFDVPPNLIPSGAETITPEMLPLVKLNPEHIAYIVQAVHGGAPNIQDIYPLAPLQEGMLFHHLRDEFDSDPYVQLVLLSFASHKSLAEFIAALQHVIDRHDALRTAVLWQRLPEPLQVVQRHAILPVEEIAPECDCEPIDQLRALMTPKGQMLNLSQAPLMRLRVAPDPRSAQWYALLQSHHLVSDKVSMDTMLREVMAVLQGRGAMLPEPVAYRSHVSQMLSRAKTVDHEAYFRDKLGDIEEPTVPFGLADVPGGAAETHMSEEAIDKSLALALRTQARSLGVSAATLFHSAWSLVVSHTSGRDDVVFGTVLLGRLHGNAGAQRTLGLFINTLPLRLNLRNITARGLVEQTQREIVELLNHEDARLAMAQRCSSIPGAAPLFSTLLNYRHRGVDLEDDFGNTPGLRVLAAKSWTNYPVLLSVDERGDGFVLSAQTARSVEPNRLTGYMREALRSLVDALENSPESKALSLSIVPSSERLEVVRAFNATEMPYAKEKLIHELFEQQVSLTPEAVAVAHEGRQLTYAQLNCWSNQLARYLRNHGVRPDQPVGICVERSLEMIVGLLGILKAGGAYMPLDPSYPVERLQHMLEDAAPRIVLTQSELLPLLPSTGADVIAVDERLKEIVANVHENVSAAELGLNAQNLVYVIYTSGSTGRPKGTAMAHRSMVNLIEWHRSAFPDSAGTRVLQFAALSFDVAFQEVFSTLCAGGTLVMLDEWIRKDARALTAFLKLHSIQRLFVPPLMLQSLAEYTATTSVAPDALKDVITAGEQLRITPEVASFFARLDRCRLHNHYGPTETHVVATLTLSGDSRAWPTLPSIGRPIANTQIYVLDSAQRPVPIGVAGEIYIGGVGVARGYLGKAELTAHRFIEDRFSAEPAARLYRTGDLARWRPDGTLEYLGRNDFQVKVRGYRIELGEIEVQLARHPQVQEAAIIAREDEPGQKRLVAYVVCREKSRPGVEELRMHLKAGLPEYMIPRAIVILEHLPLTPSGKLDRRALPAPDLGAYAWQQYEAPQGRIEETLGRVWQELLHLERIGRNDNFFELGGHSLLVLKALVRINELLSCSLRVVDLYQNPRLAELAVRISGTQYIDPFVNLAEESQLDAAIVPSHQPLRLPKQSILLTGATGFVGRFLLAELLQDSQATIYCVVRAHSTQEASSRVQATLSHWDLWRSEYERRIVAIPGDMRSPGLGLSDEDYGTIVQEIDSVYHCGASVNHLETYHMAKAANVASTQELLRIATQGRPKSLHYISTLGVFSNAEGDGVRVISEDSSIEYERHRHSRGYVASKWVGEALIKKAWARGVPCNIFRLGLMWPDSRGGRFDELQHVYRLIKSCLLIGRGIKNYRLQPDPVPVDYAARAIVALSEKYQSGGGTFHITSAAQTPGGMFEQFNQILDEPLALVPFYDWVGEVKELHQSGRSLPIVPLIEFTFEMDRRQFAEHLRRTELSGVHPSCQRTSSELADAGIRPPSLYPGLVAVCLEGMLSRDRELRELRRMQTA